VSVATRVQRSTLIGATLFVVACGALGRRSDLMSGRDLLRVDYASRSFRDSVPGVGGPVDNAAMALGLPLLNRVALPSGARELRIGSWYSMIGGTPEGVLRIVEQPGRPPTGEVITVGDENRAWGPSHRAARCTPWMSDGPGGEGRSCVTVVQTAIDWARVAQRLEELGAWTITAACEDGSYITDSGELRIARLQGERFDKYVCNAPSFRKNSPSGRAALALFDYYRSLLRTASPG
jgi:hypothetical protein